MSSDNYSNTDMTYYEYYHNQFNINIVQNLKDKVGNYNPPWWYNKHLGATIPFGKNVALPYEIQVFENEHSIFQGHWYPKKPVLDADGLISGNSFINVILFLPGLGLSAKHNFAQNFCEYVSKFGYYVIVIGTKGLDVPLKTNRFWHSGKPEDSIYAIEYLRRTFGGKLRLFLIGYSAGSNSVIQILSHYHKTANHTTSWKDPINSNNNSSTSDSGTSNTKSMYKDNNGDVLIYGAMCVCTCGASSYVDSRNRLESSFIGKYFYSAAMTHIYKEIIRRNTHIHDSVPGGKEYISTVLSKCQYLSDYDQMTLTTIHKYDSEDDFYKHTSMSDTLCREIQVPLLAIQPADDPLHIDQARSNMCLEKLLLNPNIIYMEPKYGSHFGFYEGAMHEAFTNKTSYTYPAKVAVCYFDTILDNIEKHISNRKN